MATSILHRDLCKRAALKHGPEQVGTGMISPMGNGTSWLPYLQVQVIPYWPPTVQAEYSSWADRWMQDRMYWPGRSTAITSHKIPGQQNRLHHQCPSVVHQVA